MGQIRPSLGKGSNATLPRHMGFSTPICRRAVSDPFCIFFPMMIFWKIKVNYVYLANFKLESGLRIRVTILDRRRRQRVKKHLICPKLSFLGRVLGHKIRKCGIELILLNKKKQNFLAKDWTILIKIGLKARLYPKWHAP